ICLDFLFRESNAAQRLVNPLLDETRFLAVPSLTPHFHTGEVADKAGEAARRYSRPVLYANGAVGGGTSVFVDEGRREDLRRFPDRVGLLEVGDEGVVICDVDLGFTRPGSSTRYERRPPVLRVACASLVYRALTADAAYADALAALAPL